MFVISIVFLCVVCANRKQLSNFSSRLQYYLHSYTKIFSTRKYSIANTTVYCDINRLDITFVHAMNFVNIDATYYSHIIIIRSINQKFTYSTQLDHRIATNEAIVMIFAALERRQLGLLINAKNVKFERIGAKLYVKSNGILISKKIVIARKIEDYTQVQ